jgi:O-antigen ligase
MQRVPYKAFKSQWDPVAVATVVLLAFSVVLGGASREHVLRLALVELAALPLLVLGLSRLVRESDWRRHGLALSVLAALVALPLIQLIPLPPAIWTNLAGRQEMVLALDLAGLQPGWAPLSVTPDLTWQAFLALLPPAAMFIAILTSSHVQTTRSTSLYILFALISLLLGVAQAASGDQNLYAWATTRAGTIAGLFANKNHLATLLLAMMPFAVVLGAATLRRHGEGRLLLWLSALFLGLAIVGLAAIRSRAGLILAPPVIIFSLLAGWIATGRRRPGTTLITLMSAAAVTVGAVALFALPPILARFDDQSVREERFEAWPIVASAADGYLPLGSGMGSFDAVYRSVEPLEQLEPLFYNHAHNEYLETWLEAGWPGAALILAFLIWYGRRLWVIWLSGPSRERDLQRAASIAILVMIVHSAVDYPLRTATLAVLFALCAAILEKSVLPPEQKPHLRSA